MSVPSQSVALSSSPAGSNASSMTCAVCGTALERVRYFPRQLLTADDMRVEQEYFRQKLRRHNRYLHGFGVVCGCNVVAAPTAANPWMIQVCPGYAVSPQGDEILINQCVSFDLQQGAQPPDPCTVAWPCPPQPVPPANNQQTLAYLAVRYSDCLSRPVRVPPSGCGCDQLNCEYSRVRESFELKLLFALPKSHTDALAADQTWVQAFEVWAKDRELPPPVPACPACEDDVWVVLATISIPTVTASGKTPVATSNISAKNRRALYSTQALEVLSVYLTTHQII
jgi:hypothetical protein